MIAVVAALVIVLGGGYYAYTKVGDLIGGSGTPGPTSVTSTGPESPKAGAPSAAVATPTTRSSVVATPTTLPKLGAASVKDPDEAAMITTADWGSVPSNQIGIVLKDGLGKTDADRIAKDLGGAVVGEIEFIAAYQVETQGKTEADLKQTIAKAKGSNGVDLAFPLQSSPLDEETTIKGERCSPLNDPIYQGENAKPYEMIGVQTAWDYLKASGIDLSPVKVGVIDDGLYRAKDEFGGKVKFETPNAGDELADAQTESDGSEDPIGSHGTAVASIVGANADNGGVAGVASPLGDKLSVMVTNRSRNDLWNLPAKPDPKDPTIYSSGGSMHSLGTLVAVKQQIEAGATVINMSFGRTDGDADLAAAHRRFFEKMARDHPNVLFVASAGNNGKAVDGSRRWPSGLNLSNMITVGNLENDGARRNTSNMATANFEVTIAAPGHGVPSGVGSDGKVSNEGGGTSFATPQVAATAAMLRALNPKLSAADIKRIIVEEGAAEVSTSGNPVAVEASVGGKVLRVDKAVLRVINDLRKAKGLPPLDQSMLEKLSVVDAEATVKDPKSYTIKANVGAVGEKGADVKIDLQGQGAIGGSPTKHLSAPGEVSWSLDLIDEKDQPTVVVTRLDTRSCSTIILTTVDMAGRWDGTLTIRDAKVFADVPYEEPVTGEKKVITKEECESSLKESVGKSNNLAMEFTPETISSGKAVIISFDDEDGTEERSDPLSYSVFGDTVMIDGGAEGGVFHFQGQVTLPPKGSEEQKAKLEGSWRIGMESNGAKLLEILGDLSIAKPYPPKP